MITKQFFPFFKTASDLELDHASKTFCIAVAVAATIAENLAIPSSPVKEPHLHFTTTFSEIVRRKVGQYNEAHVLNVIQALDFARKFWIYRYNIVHRKTVNVGDNSFFNGYTGVSTTFAPDEVSKLDQFSNIIGFLQTACRSVEVQAPVSI